MLMRCNVVGIGITALVAYAANKVVLALGLYMIGIGRASLASTINELLGMRLDIIKATAYVINIVFAEILSIEGHCYRSQIGKLVYGLALTNSCRYYRRIVVNDISDLVCSRIAGCIRFGYSVFNTNVDPFANLCSGLGSRQSCRADLDSRACVLANRSDKTNEGIIKTKSQSGSNG